jgi:hypothetical protein
MGLNIGGGGVAKPFAKYNAKADKWFVRTPEGGDQEIPRPTFLIDLKNIRTGWLRFIEGQAPERRIDPSLSQIATCPDPMTFKRGFVVMVHSPKFFGGTVEFSSASIHLANAIREVYAAFEAQSGKPENRGKVPVVACVGSDAMKDKYGTNYRPKLELARWVDRPAELPDAAPVEESEVGKAESRPAPASATHVPPPSAAKPAADPAFETEF